MDKAITIPESCVDLDVPFTERDDVLKHLSGLLEQRSCIEPPYAQAVIERERSFPTGLSFKSIAIAIPHADSDCVRMSSLAIGRCTAHPLFNSMEHPNEAIAVDVVVLLAIKSPEAHLAMLSNLINFFTVDENCAAIRSADNPSVVRQFVEQALYGKKGRQHEQDGASFSEDARKE